MKYKCEVVRDLLPLYIDGVSSKESNKIMEEHLKECNECKEYYNDLKNGDFIEDLKMEQSEKQNPKKTMKSIKHKIVRGKIWFGIVSITVVLAIILFFSAYMKNKVLVVQYDNNIEVVRKDGNVYAVLKNDTYINAKSKIVETVNSNGKKETLLYFYFSTTLWDNTFKPSHPSIMESKYILIPEGKGEVDKIYYYTGNYNRLEETNSPENSVLLWEK